MKVLFTSASGNRKLGPMPSSITSEDTCPASCPLKGNGCYAEYGPLQWKWRGLDSNNNAMSWEEYCSRVSKLPRGKMWRHAQAGDFPGEKVVRGDGTVSDRLDADACMKLAEANRGRRGFGYTHYPPTLWNLSVLMAMQKEGFVINLSADNLEEADKLSEHGFPVVTLLPRLDKGFRKLGQVTEEDKNEISKFTHAGRRVVVCPHYTHGVQCIDCGLCARSRKVIVGFPAHGVGLNKATAVFNKGI